MRPARLFAFAALILALAAASGRSVAAIPYAEFKPSTLALVDDDVAANNPKPLGPNSIFFMDAPKLRLVATYVGERKPISPAETDFLVNFGKALRIDVTAYAPLFRESFAFDDKGRRYWLLVQAPVADYFAKELKPGQRVALYVVSAGGIGDKDQHAAPVLLVEEFDADPATTH